MPLESWKVNCRTERRGMEMELVEKRSRGEEGGGRQEDVVE